MIDLAVLLSTASVAFGISRLAGIPVVAVLVTTGIAMASFISLPRDLLQTAMELGLAFLLFSMGIELSPERFLNRLGTIFSISIAQVIAVAIAAVYIALAFGHPSNEATLLALAVASSSTVAIIRHVRKQGQLYEPFGRLVTGVLLVQDSIMIASLVFWQQLESGQDLWYTGYGLIAMVLISALMHRVIIPRIVRIFQEDSEILLLVSLSMLFIFLGMAHWLKIPSFAGAFAAGFSLSAFPVNGLVRAQLGSVTDFFLAFFFVSVGAMITIPSLNGMLTTLALIVMLFTITPIVVTLVSERFNISSRASIESGLLLAQAGELSLAAGLFSLNSGQIDSEVFSIIALTTVISMAITPILAIDSTTFFLMTRRSRLRRRRKSSNLTGHIVVIGYGTVSRRIIDQLLKTGRQVVIVDDDPRVIASLPSDKVIGIVGDVNDHRAMQAAGLKQAHTIFSFARRTKDALHVLRLVKDHNVRVVARVFDEKSAQQITEHGGIAINAMQSAIKDFLRWLATITPEVKPAARKTNPAKLKNKLPAQGQREKK